MRIVLILTLLCAIPALASSQIFLQLERYDHVQDLKYAKGSKIHFKTDKHPDAWRKGTIDKISVQDSIIYLKDDFIHLSEITHIRTYHGAGIALSTMMYTFSGSWFLFAGIAWIAQRFEPGYDTLVIGGTAGILGWVANKFIAKRSYKIGKKNRLRLLDLSLPKIVS